MQKELVEKIRAYMLSVAQACAGAIDPVKHSSFKTIQSKSDPEYWRYFHYLNSIYTREKYISYIFTVNYDSEQDKFFYGVDGANAEIDKVWLESQLFGFSIYNNTSGQLTVKYDSTEYNSDFSIHTPNGDVKIGINNKPKNKKILINDMEVIRVISDEPFVILSAGKDVHALNRYLKIQMPLFEKNEIFSITFSKKGEPETEPGTEYIISDSEMEKNRRIIRSGKDHVDEDAKLTSYGRDLTATALIKTADGNTIGLVVLYMESKTFKESKESFLTTAAIIFILTFLGTTLIGFLFASYIASPITTLNQAVEELTAGNLDAKVILPRSDEFGSLAKSFNLMVESIRYSREGSDFLNKELKDTVDSYSRFVPTEFLKELKRENILSVALGDQVTRNMTILFSDIRAFTALSEQMTPEENFQFINGYLGRVSPIIRKHGGFIDKYIGDAVMALFPIKPQDAVLAALEMQKEVFIYNSHRLSHGYFPIQIGVGIHTGSVILGTVGEEKRMEGTVISDVVNTASRLESLTKKFGAAILISDAVYKDLPSIEQYQFRFLGQVRVKGKTHSTQIYELLDASPAEVIANKIQTRDDFHSALELYHRKVFEEAYKIFTERVYPYGKDKASEYYIKQIQKFLKYGIPENWDGVEDMEDK